LQKDLDDNDNMKKTIDELLKLEKQNFEATIGYFKLKLKNFELIKNEVDDSEICKNILYLYYIDQNDNKMVEYRVLISNIRSEINDLITNLKYN
jgi:hypothetical protein